MDNGYTDTEPGFQSYSCARCRRLKKRCPKQSPACQTCLKAGETCLYLGRAPRRTRKELEEAKLRGEFQPKKKHHTDKSEPGNSSESNTANSNSSPGLTNDVLVDPRGKPLLETDNVDGGGTQLHSPTGSSVHLDRVSSLVSVLGAMAEGAQLSTSPMGLVLNHKGASFPHKNYVDIHIQTPDQESENDFQKHKLPALRSNQWKPPLENGSTPVDALSIQAEAITGIFKGGRITPWITENGQYKPIERSLYDRFIAAYFKHNHKSFYMMDKVAFLNKVSTIRDFTMMDGEFEDHFIFQLYMAMAIGCTTLQRAEMLTDEEGGLSEHFAFLAMKRFRPVIRRQNIETIKCLLLLGIFALFEPKGVSSWTISGLIMRISIGLGFNRALAGERLKKFTPVEAELRYRVFWSAYCFERLVCTSLGRMSSIDDDEITVPLPQPLNDEEKEDLEVANMMISLRRMSGRIYKKVHLVSVGRKNYTIEQKNEIIESLRQEIDEIYQRESASINEKNANKWGGGSLSFHCSDIWLAMRYAQLQIMLYRPSVLIPKPPMKSLTKLGEFCLQALKHTYTLYKKKLLPLNWITLFRTLTICNTMLYCLCHWSIDIAESEIEIQQCVEILRHFGEKWVFPKKCAEVFQNISSTILDISLSTGQIPNMEKLTRELFGASDEYQDILDENNVDVSWIDKLI